MSMRKGRDYIETDTNMIDVLCAITGHLYILHHVNDCAGNFGTEKL